MLQLLYIGTLSFGFGPGLGPPQHPSRGDSRCWKKQHTDGPRRQDARMMPLEIKGLELGDKIQVSGSESEPKFFHVPGHKPKGFIARGLVGTIEKIYRPGETEHLDRSDGRDVVVSFTEPKKWKAHFALSELTATDAEESDEVVEPLEIMAEIDVCNVETSETCGAVSQFMTPIAEALVLSPEMPLRQAAELLVHECKTGAPVTSNGRLVGILTQFDFLYVETARRRGVTGRKVALDSGKWEETIKKSLASTVSAAMSRPIAVLAESDMQQVAELMLRRRFNHVPVVSEEKDLVGILTSQDVLRHFLFDK